MMDSLEIEVSKWARDKGIFEAQTSIPQLHKMKEEIVELEEEVFEHYLKGEDNRDKISDELGDVLVTCVVQAHFHGLSLGQCLGKAYEKISKRTGQMKNGAFVKDE